MQPPCYFAAAGDIHGDHATLVARLNALVASLDEPLAFVLQVGDFEPVRSEADLATMPGPARRRQLGSFHRVLDGTLRYPTEILFVGGNHEPYAWLESMAEGGEVAPGVLYIGRAEVIERCGLRIAGLSGIHSPSRYELPRPPVEVWSRRRSTVKEPTYFRRREVERLKESGPVNILLTHDWPGGLIGPFGNAPTRELLDTLRPGLHLAGHMHRPTQKRIRHPGGERTEFVALNQVGQGRGDLRLFRWDGKYVEEVPLGEKEAI